VYKKTVNDDIIAIGTYVPEAMMIGVKT